MSTTTTTPARQRRGRPAPPGTRPRWAGLHRARRRNARRLAGLGYATPTAVVVVVLFIVPLLLVVWMSLHKWPLLGTPTLNVPDNYSGIADNRLFRTAVLFTLKYTVVMTLVL